MSDVDEKALDDVAAVKEEPVVVNLGDDAAPPPEKKPDDEPQPEVDEREQALADLRKQLDEKTAAEARERAAREQAEKFARDQHLKVKTAEVEIQDSNLRTIVNAIDSVEQAAKAAVRAYADASANGDYEAAAEAQRSIARAESQLLQLNNGKRALEDRLQARTEGRVQDDVPQFRPQPQDPIEAMAANLTPKSAAWLRAHPDAAKHVSKLTAAHSAAVELEGIEVESPAYFEYIEKRLGMGEASPPKKEDPAPPRKQPIPSAPTNSGSGSGGGNSPSQMTLSPGEVEIAILNEPSLPRDKALEIYARNKAALIREGKLR